MGLGRKFFYSKKKKNLIHTTRYIFHLLNLYLLLNWRRGIYLDFSLHAPIAIYQMTEREYRSKNTAKFSSSKGLNRTHANSTDHTSVTAHKDIISYFHSSRRNIFYIQARNPSSFIHIKLGFKVSYGGQFNISNLQNYN
jgi:hypothetical protein